MNHPNLLTIQDVNTSDGTPCIVSETLCEKLEGDDAGCGNSLEARPILPLGSHSRIGIDLR